jgi:Uma2 family endonuclease
MLTPSRPFYTVEEYLWQEQRAENKNEYFDGTIYSRAGGSAEHSQIQSNIILELGTFLRGKDCRVLTSDLKIGVEGRGPGGRKRSKGKDFITYPGASVICGPLEYFKEDQFTVANPVVLFEVLSPSSRNYDTSFKLENYQRIPSLKAYIMIESEWVWVRSCQRIGEENRWILDEPLEDLDDVLRIETLGFEVPLRHLYERIKFEEDGE